MIISTCILGGIAALVGYMVGSLTSFNLWALIPFLFLASVPTGVINVVSYAMIGDCLDQMELETGRRETALGNACQSFVNKLGNALATTMIIAMYMIVGLDVNAMTAGGQSVEAINPVDLSYGIRNGMQQSSRQMPGIKVTSIYIPLRMP